MLLYNSQSVHPLSIESDWYKHLVTRSGRQCMQFTVGLASNINLLLVIANWLPGTELVTSLAAVMYMRFYAYARVACRAVPRQKQIRLLELHEGQMAPEDSQLPSSLGAGPSCYPLPRPHHFRRLLQQVQKASLIPLASCCNLCFKYAVRTGCTHLSWLKKLIVANCTLAASTWFPFAHAVRSFSKETSPQCCLLGVLVSVTPCRGVSLRNIP